MPLNFFATTLAVALTSTAVEARNDPYTGTWMLDLARSGGESRSQTLTIEVQGNQESYRSELVWTEGRRQVTTYVAKSTERNIRAKPSSTRAQPPSALSAGTPSFS